MNTWSLMRVSAPFEISIAIHDIVRFELRISSNGLDNQEPDFKSSYTYFIGMKKIDINAWPMFLVVPISRFAEKIYKNKLKFKFSSDDNMKIYFQSSKDLEMARFIL